MPKTTKAVRFPNGETYAWDDCWRDSVARGAAEIITGKAAADALEEYRRASLLKFIRPKSTLKVVCVHHRNTVSHYRVFVPAIDETGQPYIREITRDVADLCGFRRSSDGAIVMGGYGYSKSFQIGYSLGRMLWPNGTPEPHGTRNGEPDSCGGYAIGVN